MSIGILHGLIDEMATRDRFLCLLLSIVFYSTIGQTEPRLDIQPEFLAPLENHTVTQGRDVFFTCVVNHLQSYKIAWLKSDSRAILAMHTHMVAPNPRLSVTHNGHNTWKLHVFNVQPEDSGTYMCQVNTDPMRSQVGHMKVLTPPDIVDQMDDFDRLTSLERGNVWLRCKAVGNPKPEVTWRREDGRSITLRSENSRSLTVKTYKNEDLHLNGILRQEMGSYLCIASNGVPPSVSKRYYVNVLFKPTIRIKDQIIVAQTNDDVTFECYVESSPKSLTTWYTQDGVKVIQDAWHIISEEIQNEYSSLSNLELKSVKESDFGAYKCFTENAFGTSSAVFQLLDYQRVNKSVTSSQHNKYGKTGNTIVNHGHNELDIYAANNNKDERSFRFPNANENEDLAFEAHYEQSRATFLLPNTGIIFVIWITFYFYLNYIY
ncbi:hypothetical protein TKK_0006881 [Trichogramma kaykai]